LHLDILIFAAIAAFLIYRLNSVLGTKNGDERQRPNPFVAPDQTRPRTAEAPVPVPVVMPVRPVLSPAALDQMIDADSNKDGRVETGLAEIRDADQFFDLNTFLQGARYCFEIIVTAYARGDLPTLQPLLSPKLYGDFVAGVKAREAAGHTAELTLHRVKTARVTEAHLGGAMAYVTVDFEVDETVVTRDKSGQVVDGNADAILTIRDVWTFTRDTRNVDPNWILIETRAAEK